MAFLKKLIKIGLISLIATVAILAFTGRFSNFGCDEYPENLETCSKYSCSFLHFFPHFIMKKQVLGENEGKCKTSEEMPFFQKMNCSFTKDTRMAISEQLKNERVKPKPETLKISFGSNNQSKTPLEKAMNDPSVCKVPSYGGGNGIGCGVKGMKVKVDGKWVEVPEC